MPAPIEVNSRLRQADSTELAECPTSRPNRGTRPRTRNLEDHRRERRSRRIRSSWRSRLCEACPSYSDERNYLPLRLWSSTPAPFPAFEVLGRHLTIPGYELFQVTTDDLRLAKAKRFIVEGLASGVLRPLVGKTFGLNQIVEAHRYMEANAQIGKIVVTVP